MWEKGHDVFVLLTDSSGPSIDFYISELYCTQYFCFLGLFWDTVDMSVCLPSDKHLEIEQLAYSLLQTQPVTVHHIMSCFGQDQLLYQQTCTTLPIVSYHSE